MELEQAVKLALNGDRDALEQVVKGIQGWVYNLALSMLWHPDDAQDATQEILIKVITRLSMFEGKSVFKTWVYRVASNELLNVKAKRIRQRVNFEAFSHKLAEGLNYDRAHQSDRVEQKLLVTEAKVGCSLAMLQCLDRDHRLTYLLGEILEFNSQEGSYILGIAPATYRKRLSRVRSKVRAFVHHHCGLVNASNPCRCSKQVASNVEAGIIRPKSLLFAQEDAQALIDSVEEVRNEVWLFQTNMEYEAPEMLLEGVRRIIFQARF
ncbi:RNA polymerase sigma factor [Pontibacter sp. G13]|uniref:RNA polymerase sigma factor n=1 Tax=Pontibacter sp. G13 TaxID=3074898 RepID=UPI00288B1EB2|nr:RNA polymerase sigma factor [Pontibacter sp. G13]WNJ17754.1 RNA polymerase sigma factor [Pontibacter sp. G13]